MKLFTSISLLSSVLATSASELELRHLQRDPNPGEFCLISTSVKCELTGQPGVDCTSINPQPYGECGDTFMTMIYKFCNLLDDSNITPLRLNPTGDSGTVAMYRQVWGKPEFSLGVLAPNTCRERKVTELINTCKKRIVGDLKFEGWVDGRVDEDGYYCYGYEFLEVPFVNEPKPIKPITDPPTPAPQADISLDMQCIYKRNGVNYDCESIQFSELTFDSCTALVTLKYNVINNSNSAVRLDALIDGSLVNIIGNTEQIIAASDNLLIEKTSEINICKENGNKVTKKAIAVAGPLNGGPGGIAQDMLQIPVPLLPFDMLLDNVSCEIDGMDCNAYAQYITSPNQCVVDIKIKYTVTKTSLGCVDISEASAPAGPLGLKFLAFEDYQACSDRTMCRGDSWTIPDRRSSVNICELTVIPNNPWDLSLNVKDSLSREISFTYRYRWTFINIPIVTQAPAPVPIPPTTPVPPTAPTAPTAPVPAPTTPTGQICQGRPQAIQFSVIPIECVDSHNGLSRRLKHTNGKNKDGNGKNQYFSCRGAKPQYPISFRIYNKYNSLITSGTANSASDRFSFSPPSNTIVEFSSVYSGETQMVAFHSSCSKPIYTGETFGSFKILNFFY